MKELSRGPQLDREVIVENMGGSQYDMILIAAGRARQLEQADNSNRVIHSRSIVTALAEMQSGAILELLEPKTAK